jgi:hypothetical protein
MTHRAIAHRPIAHRPIAHRPKSGESSGMDRPSRLRRALPWIVITVAVVGIAITVTAPTAPATIGWYAYAPLSDSVFLSGPFAIHLTGQRLLGAIVSTAAFLMLSFWLGLSVRPRPGVQPQR